MSDPKRPRLESPLIGTHSGTFHADEALAVYLVRSLLKFKDARLVRTRDTKVLEGCDMVLDVGGVYDPASQRYDHHQRGFSEVYSPNHKTKLSSAGLVYKHYGTEIIAERLGISTNDPQVPTLVEKLYNEFIEGIDGVDNGIAQYEAVDEQGAPVESATVKARYRSGTSLSSRVGHVSILTTTPTLMVPTDLPLPRPAQPPWNAPSTSAILDTLFLEASKLAGEEFFSRLDYYSKAWLPARTVVVEAMEKRKETGIDEQGRVVVFEGFCPWKEHLHSLEATLIQSGTPQPLYVLYPDSTSSPPSWRIQAIPLSPDSFESRKALPEKWRGVRDADLEKVSGVSGAGFCHAAGFIGGGATREAVEEMARKALAE